MSRAKFRSTSLWLTIPTIEINRTVVSSWAKSKEAPSVLMLCAPVFIFTSGSSALLGRPRCGLSIWLSLLAIFNTLFWVYANFFTRKRTKHETYSKSAIFVWYENGRRWLLGAQSINTERVSLIEKLQVYNMAATSLSFEFLGTDYKPFILFIPTPKKWPRTYSNASTAFRRFFTHKERGMGHSRDRLIDWIVVVKMRAPLSKYN